MRECLLIDLFKDIKDWTSEEDEDDESIRSEIERLIVELRDLRAEPSGLYRLHEIERMMVDDVLTENRHLKCKGCVRWMTDLVKKAKGEDWK